MVNIEDFIKRLEIILDYYSLNASTFADKIGVQRSSMSHLLSGRNKPSLDFILKILDSYPNFDLYWLLTGKGKMLFDKNAMISDQAPAPTSAKKATSVRLDSNSNIAKMILLYKDGSFSEHFPK